MAAEERRVLSSIDGLIGELSREKEALLVSLQIHQVTFLSLSVFYFCRKDSVFKQQRHTCHSLYAM